MSNSALIQYGILIEILLGASVMLINVLQPNSSLTCPIHLSTILTKKWVHLKVREYYACCHSELKTLKLYNLVIHKQPTANYNLLAEVQDRMKASCVAIFEKLYSVQCFHSFVEFSTKQFTN